MQSVGGGRIVRLGGLGGDSHSVGVHVLRRALSAEGYGVEFLGTQNALASFFDAAEGVDAVLISCMDGHARHYLGGFEALKAARPRVDALFYLGGNPTLHDDSTAVRDFRRIGFHRVFTSFVDVTTVLALLRSDLGGRPRRESPARVAAPRHEEPTANVSARRMDDARLEAERVVVCAQWSTGEAALDLEDNAVFLQRRPSFAQIQSGLAADDVLVQPRVGIATFADQLRVFETLEASGARVLSFQVDSLTRNNDYRGVAAALAGHAQGGVGLNGFPVVNHGVEAVRTIARSIEVPLQTRHSTRDPRLLAEVSYAGGVTGFEGGAISYNIPYYKRYALDEAITKWQFVDRLTAIYAERFGVVLDREFFGTLTATLVPPCVAIAVNLLEAWLAAAQGVRSVSLGYAEQGHRVQDVAAVRLMAELGRELLPDVRVHTVFHQYMAAFPPEPARAEQLIFESAVTGRLAGATRMMLKTAVEARSIPSAEDNAAALGIALAGVAEARARSVDEALVDAEKAVLRREVSALVDAVLEAGRGDVARGVVAAFARGVLDVPWSPSVYNRGEVMTARDCSGAVRFVSTGQMPLSAEIRAFHEERIRERLSREGLRRDQAYQLVEHDVLRVPRGLYRRWPLDDASGDEGRPRGTRCSARAGAEIVASRLAGFG